MTLKEIRIPPFVCFGALLLISCAHVPEPTYVGNPQKNHDILRPLLNSERIALIFGSYGIDVVQKSPIRVSNLYSGEDPDKTCRTFALVFFASELPKVLTTAYSRIRAGESLGATLKQEGWQVTKKHRYFGEIEMGRGVKLLARLPESDSVTSAVHIYDLYAQSNARSVFFATIVETHHPGFLTLQDLIMIHLDDAKERLSRTDDIERYLEVLTREMGKVRYATP